MYDIWANPHEEGNEITILIEVEHFGESNEE